MRTLVVIVAALTVAVSVAPAHPTPGPSAHVRDAIRLAATTFRVSYREMVNVARCETGGTFDPHAYNPRSGASGIFQFLPGTFRRTPYRMFNIFDAHANAMAAAWLYVHDGRSWREWECGPA